MSNEVNGPLPPAHRARVQIVRVDWTEPREFTCISEVPWTKFVHYIGGRSEECLHPHDCAACNIPVNKKWQMWLQVLNHTGKEMCYLEMTETAYDLMKFQLHHGKNWRGLRFRVCKTKGGKKGRFRIEVLERRIESRDLPPSVAPIGILKFLWNAGRNRPGQFRDSEL